MGADGSRVIEAFNPIGARAGDTVRISIGSGVVLLAAFVVFIVPIFGILIGYAVGVSVGGSQHAGVVGALVGLIASFLVARWWDRRMLRSKRHVPTIIEIVSRAEEVGSGMGAG
jgi:sigma-E factor negative regulatory protein RseC